VKRLFFATLALAAACAALAAGPVVVSAAGPPSPASPPYDGIGSIISSFKLSAFAEPYALGVYRGPSYVYGVMYFSGADYLYRFSTGGSLLASFALDGTSQPRGADVAHLGSGYLSLVDAGTNRLYVFRTTGGAPITSFPVAASPNAQNCFWDGTYYHVNGSANLGRFNRYTPAGAAAGKWTCAAWPAAMTTIGGAAYAHRGNGGDGPYFVACSWSPSQPSCMTTYPGGSLVRTWATPMCNGNGMAYGDSSKPGVYGAAVWSSWYTGTDLYAMEFDVGARNAAAFVPVSLGQLKALYH
jgi:hypothetical protein